MAQALVFLAQNIGSAGIAIILFTIGIKLLLVPLTLQQLKSAKAMQELQPKIKELQAKYKGDKQKQTEETMALYKEHKVNPAAGCFPLLIQLPILYGLYGALLALGNACASRPDGACVPDPLFNPLFAQPFLWLNGHVVAAGGAILTGLSAPDPWHILPVLAVLTQWVQQRMMMGKNQQADQQQQAMQGIMQFMPLMIGIFSWNLAAGLPLYWVVSTLFSIVQQYFITGWGQLFQRPSLAGIGGLLGGGGGGGMLGGPPNSRNGAGRNGREPRRMAPPAKVRTPPATNKGKRRRAG